MRRLAIIFSLLAFISTAMRIVTPERIASVAVVKARALSRVCLLFAKRLRPLLPGAV